MILPQNHDESTPAQSDTGHDSTPHAPTVHEPEGQACPPDDATAWRKLSKEFADAKPDFWEMWLELDPLQQLEEIVDHWRLASWSSPEALRVFALWYTNHERWLDVIGRAKELGASHAHLWHLEQAVKQRVAGFSMTNGQAPTSSTTTGLNLVVTASVTETDVAWLWWPYLPLGHLAMLDGEPGVGKSLLTLALAAAISKAYHLPDQHGRLTMPVGDPAFVLLISNEDSLASTIKPRLMQCGADCSNIIALTGWHNETTKPGEEEAFTFDQLPLLEEGLKQYRPRLVVLDPIQAYLGGKVDINRSNETRPLLAALAKYAERYQSCIVIVRHPAKSGQGSAIHRGLGSIDFVGAARSALFVTQHPMHSDQALLVVSAKSEQILGSRMSNQCEV